jgi:Protein of unknown function (DUF3574)
MVIALDYAEAQQSMQAFAVKPALIQEDLYFERNIGPTGQVSERQFQQFLKDEVTPLFPDGLTVYNATGQLLDSSGQLIQAPSQVVSLIFEDTQKNSQAIDEIINAYKRKFQQESVLQVANQEVAIGFGQGEDLIQNDPTPELIQVDLYFGRNIGTDGQVTEQQFRQFLRDEVTPRFPDGLTTYNAKGQFLDSSNRLIREPSKVVSLIIEDTQKNESSILEVIDAYKQKFQQESVLEVVNEEVKVGFGQGENLIDNDPIPEQIQVDLYFGRNIGNTGQVTEGQFQQFLGTQITSRFPDGLTVYDANGQFLDSSKMLIREPSKVVSFIMEDTQKNEQSIDEIINAYKQEFQQESVLQVVDETVGTSFSAAIYPPSTFCFSAIDDALTQGISPTSDYSFTALSSIN